MAAIYSNGGNRWNIEFLASILLKEMRYLVYIRYLCCKQIKNTVPALLGTTTYNLNQ